MNMYYCLAIAGVVIASFSQILLKKGANEDHGSFIRDYLNLPVITGYILMAMTLVLSMLAYRGVPYMNIPVIEAVGFVLVPILSYFFFKEKITLKKSLGIAVIMLGIGIYYL
ncbi:MAG: multidrug ABC transporter [Lachnospiraceae bacterium]|nr:multidrug ABC transporter [Lachnospiraceae bacterium]